MGDEFGRSVAIWGDEVVVGAPYEDSAATGVNGNQTDDSAVNSGAVYSFDLITEPTFPEIEIELDNGSIAVAGADTVNFGQIGLGGSVEKAFILRNEGDGDLAGIGLSFTGTDASQFAEVTSIPVSLSAGQSAVFSVVYTPTGPDGSRSANLVIVSNDADENPFIIGLAAAVVDAQQQFDNATSGSSLTGDDALPLGEPFGDGVNNLLKYAFNMNLGGFDATRMVSGGTTGLPGGELVLEGGQVYWQVQYVRRKGSGLIYAPQKTTSLTEEVFIPMTGAITVEEIDGQWERVIINEPCDPATIPICFSKVQVTLP